ncbi:MAG: hypothetical protein S4CHLAM20_02170 [Chlamydiia bacterium]|nr:hypothetical protein [Chlamydiia bacterium]
MANRLRQTVQSIEGTPAEQRMDAGGLSPDLARALVPAAEMLPGAGFVTGVQKGGSEGGLDVLAELIGLTGGALGTVGGPVGTVAGYTLGKGAVKGLRSLLKPEEISKKELDKYQEAWKSENKLANRQKQKDSVSDAAVKLDEGKITSKEFRNIVKRDLPIKPIDNMVEVPSFENIIGALKKPQVEEGIINLNKKLEDGTRVASRLDIPAYDNYDQWIVSIHDGTKSGGKAVGYGKTATLNNVEFKSSAKGALNIAKTKEKGGTDKGTIARIYGDWKNIDDNLTAKRAERILTNRKDNKYIDPEDNSEWVQVGMNPFRSSYFYDKLSGSPLRSAEEVIQVGPLVFAKGAIRAKPSDFKKDKTRMTTTKADKKIAFNQGGSVVERNPYNYQARAI